MTIKSGAPTPTPTAPAGADAETLGAQQFLMGFNGVTPPDTGKVYMGMTPTKGKKLTPSQLAALPPSAQEQALNGGATIGVDKWMSTDDAANTYFTWTQKQRDDFRAKGLLSGLLTQGAGDLEAFSLWQSLVKQAGLYGAQGQRVGPLDILSGYVKANSNGGWIKQGDFEINPVTGEKRYIGPKFKTTTQTNANLTDPATARAIATKVFQDLLGRDPGQGEISAYAQALSQSEQQNPNVTTTTTQFDPTTGEAVNSSSVTEGGMTAEGQQLLASDEIKKKAEYGATQAATTYQNALEQAVYGSR